MRNKRIRRLITVATAVCMAAVYLIVLSQNVYAVDYIFMSDGWASSDWMSIIQKYPARFEFKTNGENQTSIQRVKLLMIGCESAYFDEPVIECCDHCRETCENGDYFSTRIYIQKEDGKVMTTPGLSISGLENETFTTGDVCLEISQKPGPLCSYCGRRAGDTIYVDSAYLVFPSIRFNSQPLSATVEPGGNATFDFSVRYKGEYSWGVYTGDEWSPLTEGVGSGGESYTGTDKTKLTISNVTAAMDGTRYSCKMKGAFGWPVYTDIVTLSVPAPTVTTVPDPVTPTPAGPTPAVPTPDPDPGPAGPVITPPPAGPDPSTVPIGPATTTPTPAPDDPGGKPSVIPSQGGKTSYTPASSTAVIPAATGSGGGNVPSSTTVKSGTAGTSGGNNGTYTGTVTAGAASSGIPSKVTAEDPSMAGKNGGATSSGGGSKGTGTSGRGKSGPGTGSSSSGRIQSSSTGLKVPGSSTMMKNGVLYIIDEDDRITAETENSTGSKPEETVDVESEYQAEDLAVQGEMYEQTQNGGFWNTIPGFLTIAAIILLLLLLALFFLFFGVIVFGEMEEHDEVFELCSVRLMKRKDGQWKVATGSAFDDNAVLKLRVGLVFALMFADWDITAEVSGMYEGEVTGQLQQGMLLYRKDIRRNI